MGMYAVIREYIFIFFPHFDLAIFFFFFFFFFFFLFGFHERAPQREENEHGEMEEK